MGFEQAKNIYIETEPLFMNKGILSTTMKMQRFAAKKVYAEQIEKMYQEGQLEIKWSWIITTIKVTHPLIIPPDWSHETRSVLHWPELSFNFFRSLDNLSWIYCVQYYMIFIIIFFLTIGLFVSYLLGMLEDSRVIYQTVFQNEHKSMPLLERSGPRTCRQKHWAKLGLKIGLMKLSPEIWKFKLQEEVPLILKVVETLNSSSLESHLKIA